MDRSGTGPTGGRSLVLGRPRGRGRAPLAKRLALIGVLTITLTSPAAGAEVPACVQLTTCPAQPGSLPAAERQAGEALRSKTPKELLVEMAIRQAYRAYVRLRLVGDQVLTVRVPFGQQGERFASQSFLDGAKASPAAAWARIDEILAGADFRAYVERLSQPGSKLVLLRLPERTVEVITDPARMAATKSWCLGNELYPCRLQHSAAVSEVNVYDYLYAMGVGIDCSGFTGQVLVQLARLYGVNLKSELGVAMTGFGNWVFQSPWVATTVSDRIIDLRPGDVILFNCWSRPACHSAIVGEVDFREGWLLVYQSTDWVGEFEQRGVHEMKIHFDPANPHKSLADPALSWNVQVGPVFPEEAYPYVGQDYGYRYRIVGGRGEVVRLNLLAELMADAEPLYFQAEVR